MLEAFKKIFVPGYVKSDKEEVHAHYLVQGVRAFFSYLAILSMPIGLVVAIAEQSYKAGIIIAAEILAGIMVCMLFLAWCYGVCSGED